MPLHKLNPQEAPLPADIETYFDGEAWFYWLCLPGADPESPAVGPFDSEDAALAHAREGWLDPQPTVNEVTES